MNEPQRPPLPPFTLESAVEKVRLAEDGWNSRDPAKVALAYTVDSEWRNRSEFVTGREAIVAFLSMKWRRELDYRLIKELWAFGDNRIAVRFAYEWHDESGNWFRSFGNENWEFNESGLMRKRYACINDLPIRSDERCCRWPLGRRPDDHPGLNHFGFESDYQVIYHWPEETAVQEHVLDSHISKSAFPTREDAIEAKAFMDLYRLAPQYLRDKAVRMPAHQRWMRDLTAQRSCDQPKSCLGVRFRWGFGHCL